MNVYLTNGTVDYLSNLHSQHRDDQMMLMHAGEDALLLHETEGESVFNEPRKYEVIDSSGTLDGAGFAVLNNIPVTEEGRPIFEYRFKNRAGLIESEPGFVAIRVLRPLSNDTYVILTLWQEEKDFKAWQDSQAYNKAHEKRGTEQGVDKQQPQIFARPSFVTSYEITTG
ncbi:antibiotic biosynthesis monooxygenase [Cytobacillus spongiae]|jgi:heme-degrading monooxygenase HmoA|uniref:antibiotic biosynthesis monooxygenase family protein n=1 Tax=Cytobacillus spongiae TaxID=2901381 RepID=UPI001F44BA74|nr:antibiotic biosynthesis monooxygenase [Cytobacillus spongiae]UII56897.1 antibiotic biosynthesis monooxygenase [Cytobacillus spongiae]